MQLTCIWVSDNIIKVLPFILVTLEDMKMSYEKVAQAGFDIIIGTKQTLKAMKNGEVNEVITADDADQSMTLKVAELARQLNIPHTRVPSMEELGNACGIDVGAATVAIKQ